MKTVNNIKNNVAIKSQICKSNLVRELEGQDAVISLDRYAVFLHVYECSSVFLYETSSEHMLQTQSSIPVLQSYFILVECKHILTTELNAFRQKANKRKKLNNKLRLL